MMLLIDASEILTSWVIEKLWNPEQKNTHRPDIHNPLILVIEATEIVLINVGSLEAYIELYGIRGEVQEYMSYGTLNVENGLVGALQVEQEAENGSDTTRVGRWMAQEEYDKMISTGKVHTAGE